LSYRVTNDVAVIPVVEYPLQTFAKREPVSGYDNKNY